MGEHGGFRASLESEPCREESTGELESWLSRLKKQHQGGLPRAPLFKDSCPSWTAPLTEELTFSVAYLVTKRTVAKRETGSIIFTCGTRASRTRKSRKMTSVPSLGPLNGAKTLKCWGVFTIPLASMNTGNVSPQWSDCRKVLLFLLLFSSRGALFLPLFCLIFMLTDFAWAAPPLPLVPVCLRKFPSPSIPCNRTRRAGRDEAYVTDTVIWSGAVVMIMTTVVIGFLR